MHLENPGDDDLSSTLLSTNELLQIPSQTSQLPLTSDFLLDRIAETSKSMANGQWSEGHDQQTSDGSGPASEAVLASDAMKVYPKQKHPVLPVWRALGHGRGPRPCLHAVGELELLPLRQPQPPQAALLEVRASTRQTALSGDEALKKPNTRLWKQLSQM